MEMFNFVLDSFKRGIFDFKVKWQDLIAGTVYMLGLKGVVLGIPKMYHVLM